MDQFLALAGLALIHLLAVASPGPSTVLLIQTSAGAGRSAGLLAALAMTVGALTWAMAALFGLQVLFDRFHWLYVAFRIGGALYLLYLAVVLWRHAREPLPDMTSVGTTALSRGQVFARAMLLQLTNPNIIMFFGSVFLAMLPQHMPLWMDGLVLVIIGANEFAIFALLAVLFSSGPAQVFYRKAKFWLDRFMGGALVLLGLRLALATH